jgi:hypothetical protein
VASVARAFHFRAAQLHPARHAQPFYALWAGHPPFGGWPARRAGVLRPSFSPLDTSSRTGLHILPQPIFFPLRYPFPYRPGSDDECYNRMLKYMNATQQVVRQKKNARIKDLQNYSIQKQKFLKQTIAVGGLRASEEIKQGDFVIEYVGELIDNDEEKLNLWKLTSQ